MRILSVGFCSIIFWLSLKQVSSIIDSSAGYGILLATTPMVSFLVGSINPSSLEIISGISLSILLASYPQLSERKTWTKSHTLSTLLIATILAVSRPHAWVFTLILFLVAYIRFFSKRNPLKNVFILVATSVIKLVMVVAYLKSGLNKSGLLAPPALPQQILESQFSGLDNYIYDSIGYFAWIMSYKGIELIHILWVALIILLFIWSMQQFSIKENVSLGLITFISTIFMPLAVYYAVFKAGYGYQARYSMAILCSISIFAVIGNSANLRIPKNQIAIVLYFAPLALISDWLISGFRYSHGLPFQLLVWGNRSFSIWLSKPQFLFTILIFVAYLILSKKLIDEARNQIWT
jgi:hypothetical protein